MAGHAERVYAVLPNHVKEIYVNNTGSTREAESCSENDNVALRFCVDYRRLNALTCKHTFPLPRIGNLLDQLKDKSIFTTLDARRGYWQIRVQEESQEKTAFVTFDGLYEFWVMPFGLCNTPATFQRAPGFFTSM